MYDRRCQQCGESAIDCFEPISSPNPCCSCGGELVRVLAAPALTPDGIPGGLEIRHGICWPDGTPRRYDSRSEMKREAKALGLENTVRHVPADPGSDKSKHTTRWASVPVITEAERIRAWRAHELANGFAPPADKDPSLGVGVVVEGTHDRVSQIIAESIQKIESSGFHERDYAPVPRR